MQGSGAPVVGERYITPQGRIFEVLAVDDTTGAVEIRHDDGAVEKLDFDDWHHIRPRSIDTSDDWIADDYTDFGDEID